MMRRIATLTLAALVFFPVVALDQDELPQVAPDNGNLTISTAIHNVGGSLEFVFSKNVRQTWGGTVEGRRKMRALVEVLIYRKFAVEFLLKNRIRLRLLAGYLGIPENRQLFFPDHLSDVLASAFSVTTFPELNEKWVEPLKAGVAFAPQFSGLEDEAFWRGILDRAIGVVQRSAIASHHEMETLTPAQASMGSGTPSDEWETEKWRADCNIDRAQLARSKYLSNTPRGVQNEQAAVLLTSLDGSEFQGDRLLYTPMDYEGRFPGDTEILRDVNGIRPFPSVASFERSVWKGVPTAIRKPWVGTKEELPQGNLANVLVAIALHDLEWKGRFSWRRASYYKPRSELLCEDWSQIPFDQVSPELFQPNGPIRAAYRDAVIEALRLNAEAIEYLSKLDQTSTWQIATGHRFPWQPLWRNVEAEPTNPQEMLDKFIDLLPMFERTEEIMKSVRKTYPLGTHDSDRVRESLYRVYELRQASLANFKEEIVRFNFVTIGGALVTGGAFARIALSLMFISDSIIGAFVIWPEWIYRQDIATLTTAVFSNVDPEHFFTLTAKNLHEVVVLDQEASWNFRLCFYTVGAMGLWWKGMPLVSRFIRNYRGVTEAGNIVLDEKGFYARQKEFMKFMKMFEARFPDSVATFREEGFLAMYYEKIYGFVPDSVIKVDFPEVYQQLRKAGITLRMNPAERAGVARSLGLPEDARLWDIALKKGFVDEVIDGAEYLAKVEAKPQAYWGNEAQRLLHTDVTGRSPRAIEKYRDRLKDKLKTLEKEHSPLEEQHDIQKQINHTRNLEKVIDAVDAELAKMKFDDSKSKTVLNWIEFFRRTSKWRPLGWVYGVLRKAMTTPPQSKLIPIEAVSSMPGWKARIYDRLPAEIQDAVSWSMKKTQPIRRTLAGDIHWAKPVDHWLHGQVIDLGKRIKGEPWFIDKETFSKGLLHQGGMIGVPVSIIGDRIARKERGVEFFGPEEWDETFLNISIGFVQAGYTNAISAMNVTYLQRVQGQLALNWGNQLVVGFIGNTINLGFFDQEDWQSVFRPLPKLGFAESFDALQKMKFWKGDKWAGVVDAMIDRECALAIMHRMHFAPIFHGTWSVARNRSFWLFRNMLRNEEAASAGFRTNATIGVISYFDKVYLGGRTWTWAQKEPAGIKIHAEGKCHPLKEPFASEMNLWISDAAEEDNFERAVAERTGMVYPGDLKALAAARDPFDSVEEGEDAVSP